MSSDRGLPNTTVPVVASIAQHRTLTTAQLQAIHFPERSRRWTQRVLKRLERAGLLSWVRLPSSPGRIRLWFVTEQGALLAERSRTLADPPKSLTAEQAGGQLHAHTLAVNDAAICFFEAARRRSDDFGPLAWRHEVAHALSAGRRRRQWLVADAVLTYVRGEGDDLSVLLRFVELDRATLSVDRLAAELGRYADLYRAEASRGEPLWRSAYPVFPRVHCVLTGAPRAALERRRTTAVALLRSDPRMALVGKDMSVSFVLLDDLKARGPFAPVFIDVGDPQRAINWLGDAGEGAG
jgi:DNA-binding MarR family transcriptional regulator